MATINQVADMADVSALQLLRWSQRYKLVGRGGLGMRLAEDDVSRLLLMSELVARGLPESQAARTALDRVPRDHRGLPHRTSELVTAAASMDVATLQALLSERLPNPRFEPMVDEWLMPELRRVGEAWASDDISTSQEEFVSSGVLVHLFDILRDNAPLSPEPPVLLGLPDGQFHELPLLALAVALSLRGVPVRYLGASAALKEWTRIATTTPPPVVVLAARSSAAARAASDLVHRLRPYAPDCTFWVGGSHAPQVRNARQTPDSIAATAAMIAGSLISQGTVA